MIAISVEPLSANPLSEPLVFQWDEVSGEVSGPDADIVRAIAGERGVPLHPVPAWHEFSAYPLKSRRDVAAIVGYLHKLPPELADAYPAVDGVSVIGEMLDVEGNTVGTVEGLF